MSVMLVAFIVQKTYFAGALSVLTPTEFDIINT